MAVVKCVRNFKIKCHAGVKVKNAALYLIKFKLNLIRIICIYKCDEVREDEFACSTQRRILILYILCMRAI